MSGRRAKPDSEGAGAFRPLNTAQKNQRALAPGLSKPVPAASYTLPQAPHPSSRSRTATDFRLRLHERMPNPPPPLLQSPTASRAVPGRSTQAVASLANPTEPYLTILRAELL